LRAAGHRPLAVDLLVDAPLGVATLPALGHGFEDIPAVQADMEDLPFARGGFQRAVSFGSFPYVRDAPCWLRRLHDVLAPGGELALPMTPVHRGRDAAERAGASRSASLARARTRATYHHFTQDGLCSLLEAAGFRPRFEEPDYPRLFRLVRSAKRSVLGDGAAGFPLILAKRVP
jgi:SAM-dependent methyltransferase